MGENKGVRWRPFPTMVEKRFVFMGKNVVRESRTTLRVPSLRGPIEYTGPKYHNSSSSSEVDDDPMDPEPLRKVTASTSIGSIVLVSKNV